LIAIKYKIYSLIFYQKMNKIISSLLAVKKIIYSVPKLEYLSNEVKGFDFEKK
jgi:hypothetical protein